MGLTHGGVAPTLGPRHLCCIGLPSLFAGFEAVPNRFLSDPFLAFSSWRSWVRYSCNGKSEVLLSYGPCEPPEQVSAIRKERQTSGDLPVGGVSTSGLFGRPAIWFEIFGEILRRLRRSVYRTSCELVFKRRDFHSRRWRSACLNGLFPEIRQLKAYPVQRRREERKTAVEVPDCRGKGAHAVARPAGKISGWHHDRGFDSRRPPYCSDDGIMSRRISLWTSIALPGVCFWDTGNSMRKIQTAADFSLRTQDISATNTHRACAYFHPSWLEKCRPSRSCRRQNRPLPELTTGTGKNLAAAGFNWKNHIAIFDYYQ